MMSNLRESYAATSLAGLGWDENQEKAIDRVAASGKASALGVCLWKSKYMLEGDAYRKAHKALLVIFQARYADEYFVAGALVGQAMREYIAPQCTACNGEGERMVNDGRVVCDFCSGSKTHRYSDTERAKLMQISYGTTKASAHKIRWLLEFMESEDRIVNHQLNIELERFKTGGVS
jgi:hypothetical protein